MNTYAYRFRNDKGEIIANMYGFTSLVNAISHAQSSPIWRSDDWEYFELKGPELDWLKDSD